jgi:hypothetical protein
MKAEPSDLDEILKDPDKLLKMLVRETRMLSQPIDFADLERRGILSKDGTGIGYAIYGTFRSTQLRKYTKSRET